MTMNTPDGRAIHSALEEAIYLRLGGAVPACHKLKVSTQAIYKLLQTGYVSSRKLALKIEKHTKVPAAELMKLAPWTGPSDRPSGPDAGTRGARHRPKDAPLLAVVPPLAPPVGASDGPGLILGSRVGRVVRPETKGKRTPPRDNRRACTSRSKSRIVLVGTLRA